MPTTSIEQEITNWDGKSASDINAIYLRHKDSNKFVTRIIDISKQVTMQKGATCLLKRYFESGQIVTSTEVAMLFGILPKIETWESKLHILQCMPYVQIGETEKDTVETFLRICLIDSNKFVRAWAYSGFYELSVQYPEYATEAMQFIVMAKRDEVPSVKARIRQIEQRALSIKFEVQQK